MAIIDHGILNSLVVAALSAALEVGGSKITLLLPGDADPEPDIGGDDGTGSGGAQVAKATARLIAIDFDGVVTPRDAGGVGEHTAIGNVVVTIGVTAPAAKTAASFGALSTALSTVAGVLGGATLRDAATTHQVDFEQTARQIADPNVDEQRKVMTGAVVFTGTVTRESGASVADHL